MKRWITHWKSLPPGNRFGVVLCLVLLAATLVDLGLRITELVITPREADENQVTVDYWPAREKP
jgi:hypothetical protein